MRFWPQGRWTRDALEAKGLDRLSLALVRALSLSLSLLLLLRGDSSHAAFSRPRPLRLCRRLSRASRAALPIVVVLLFFGLLFFVHGDVGRINSPHGGDERHDNRARVGRLDAVQLHGGARALRPAEEGKRSLRYRTVKEKERWGSLCFSLSLPSSPSLPLSLSAPALFPRKADYGATILPKKSSARPAAEDGSGRADGTAETGLRQDRQQKFTIPITLLLTARSPVLPPRRRT